MIIEIGTFVLCHLLVPTNGDVQNQKQQKIEKIAGIVKEIEESDSYEMIGNSYAINKKKYNLIVEPKEKDKIFRVGSDACKPIVSESTHLNLVNKNNNKDSIKKQKNDIKNNPLLKELE